MYLPEKSNTAKLAILQLTLPEKIINFELLLKEQYKVRKLHYNKDIKITLKKSFQPEIIILSNLSILAEKS